jgi:hypothetical protein
MALVDYQQQVCLSPHLQEWWVDSEEANWFSSREEK